MSTPSERIRAVLARAHDTFAGQPGIPAANLHSSIIVDEEQLAALLGDSPKPQLPRLKIVPGASRMQAAGAK